MSSAFYEPLIERDLAAIPAAARAFADEHSLDELYVSVARFAVLAYAPSMHAKRAVLACRAASSFRTLDIITECASYAAESRQPWSEPPILDPPPPSSESLDEVLAAGDRPRAEAWLAARLEDADRHLRAVAHDDALLVLDASLALLPLLGEKGRYALLRMPLHELLASPAPPSRDGPLDAYLDRAIASRGAIEDVQSVFVWCARHQPDVVRDVDAPPAYRLARDYAQTLIAHDVARRLPSSRVDEFLQAVHHNLEHGESFAEWSFA